MDLQKAWSELKTRIEEQDKAVVAQLRNQVPHDLAGSLETANLQGYAKAIGNVKTIMEDIIDEQRKREEEESGTDSDEDNEDE